MLKILLEKGKKILLVLLMGMLILSSSIMSYGEEEYIRFSVEENKIEQRMEVEEVVVPTWQVREYDVIVRVGEFDGKQGKRVYINEGINWKDIPKDIKICKDTSGYYIQEFDINKKIAERVYNKLIEKGVNAKLQIANGKSEDLNASARIANKSNPKLYLSLHTNCYNGQARGYFGMYNPNDVMGKNIAIRLANSIKDNGLVSQRDNRPNTNNYIGELAHLNNSTAGVLMELGFFDNYEELINITSDEYANYIAENLSNEIVKVLDDFWK